MKVNKKIFNIQNKVQQKLNKYNASENMNVVNEKSIHTKPQTINLSIVVMRCPQKIVCYMTRIVKKDGTKFSSHIVALDQIL